MMYSKMETFKKWPSLGWMKLSVDQYTYFFYKKPAYKKLDAGSP